MSNEQEYRDYILPYYYGIKASWALAVAATFLFACVTLTHVILLWLKRAWFLIPLLFGALFETIGYAFRAAGLHENVPNPTTYVTFSSFTIIAPALIAASLYQLLAHIMIASGRGGSKVFVRFGLGLGFEVLDILSYALQAAGAANLKWGPFGTNSSALPKTLSQTRSLLLAGNVINLLTLIIFLALTFFTHFTTPSPFSNPTPGLRRLYTCLSLLFIRTLYRVVAYSRGLVDPRNQAQYTQGLRINPLFREGWMYGFDALLIFAICVALAAWYPGKKSLEEEEELTRAAAGVRSSRSRSRDRVLGWFGKTRPRAGSSLRMEGIARA